MDRFLELYLEKLSDLFRIVLFFDMYLFIFGIGRG